MSVYIARDKAGAPKSPYWQYDFQCRGARFSGSFDGEEGRPQIRIDKPKSEAERAEAALRSAAAAGQRQLPRLTLNEAAAHYWTHEAQFHANADSEWGFIANLERLIGKKTYIDTIDDEVLIRYVARRRAEKARRRKNLVSNATVNRDTETLQFILRSVSKVARLPDPMPDFGARRLKETKRVRSLTVDEDQALFTSILKLRPDYFDFVDFALSSLKRLSEVIFLEKRNVDWHSMTARVIAKGGREIVIPLTEHTAAIVRRNWMHHPTRVFTFVAQRNSKDRRKGRRYAFTVDGWRDQWKAILEDAAIVDFRFHDLRHTGASRVLQTTGNLKAAQEALDHQDIRSTARYAHLHSEQKRAALEAAERVRARPVPELPQNGKSEKPKLKDGTEG